MKEAKNYQEYLQLSKEGLKNHYIWRWSKNKGTPDNWLSATPVKVLGFVIGWKVKVVKKGYENIFFN